MGPGIKEQGPTRIVCLTAETAEVIYALGEGKRVVGVSGYTVWPPEARKKPKVGGYSTPRTDKILALNPDLVLSFSDLQADVSSELIRKGVTVVGFNQRSLEETLNMIRMIGSLVGRPKDALRLVAVMEAAFGQVRAAGAALPRKPRVYFEEWSDPMISGIRWVSEMITLAGGEDIFPEFRDAASAKDRVVSSEEVIKRNPDVIVASWCGRRVRPERISGRPGWSGIRAVVRREIHEIKSAHILQPGPSLVTGLQQLHRIISGAAGAA
ncbi:MAG TPA: cobalamin-binding protein [Nitrospiria bacterium]